MKQNEQKNTGKQTREGIQKAVQKAKKDWIGTHVIVYQQNLFKLAGRPWLMFEQIWRTGE